MNSREIPKKIYLETVESRVGGVVFMSYVREATQEEIEARASEYEKTGKCDHGGETLLIYDLPAFLYDYRFCAVCHVGLGCI